MCATCPISTAEASVATGTLPSSDLHVIFKKPTNGEGEAYVCPIIEVAFTL